MSKLKNIKFLYNKIENKEHFLNKVADNFKVDVAEVKVNWFGDFKIRKDYHGSLVSFLQNYIKHSKIK